MKFHSRIMHAFLYWLTDRLPARWINDGTKRYLERYYLFTKHGKRYYLHHFVGSDPDRGLHNHKWHAWSFILCGWYWEYRQWGSRKVRWFNKLNPDTLHRVVLPVIADLEVIANPISNTKMNTWKNFRDQPCWTLFVHNADEELEHWGFKREIHDEQGAWFIQPYKYEREGSQKDWWINAPKGRDLRAAIVHKAEK